MHGLGEWADIVAEVANRRRRVWRFRLGRNVDYDMAKLKEIAQFAARLNVLGDESAMNAVTVGFVALEIAWIAEARLRGVPAAGRA